MADNNLAVVNEDAEILAPSATSSQTDQFVSDFRKTFRLAKTLCNSQLIPQIYQGKPDDCAIAIDMASRIGISPIMVMQNLYVVKGKPSWSGSACMAFLRNKYRDVIPVYIGTPNTDSWGCYIKAKTADGDEIKGSTITMAMVKNEGWLSKPGSKWKTMPEQMLAYRAAAFFARVYCPEVLMGVSVQGEVEDMTADEKPEEAPNPFSDAVDTVVVKSEVVDETVQ